MTNNEILAQLDLGSSVAENDLNLHDYFVPTTALNDFVVDRFDIIRGVKGSGKSAILKVVSQQQGDYIPLNDVVLNVATEHTGEPSFKRAFATLKPETYDEVEIVNAWKTYLINLALDVIDGMPHSAEAGAALHFAEKTGLRYATTSTYKKIWWSLLRMVHIKKFEVGADKISLEFPDSPPEFWTKSEEIVDFPEALRLCVEAFSAHGRRCWLMIDRLDAAFQDQPELEQIALRALIIAYKDFMGHPELRLKLFLRTDLFDQIVSTSGFRELTHIQDRTSPPILWDSDKLYQLIVERFAFNESIREKYGFSKEDIDDSETRKLVFQAIFPKQVDPGKRKSETWNWMLSRIRDGLNVQTPRDLHGLVQNAARRQAEILALGTDETGEELISSAALKSGLSQLSTDKIRTTLIAENPTLEIAIRAFEKQKAEHNDTSLADLLGANWRDLAGRLVRIGLLADEGTTWKVPMLYRDGLEITQGAAFNKEDE